MDCQFLGLEIDFEMSAKLVFAFVINCLCKIFMTVISTRLTEWADTNNVIDESQAGLRKGYNTIDNIF